MSVSLGVLLAAGYLGGSVLTFYNPYAVQTVIDPIAFAIQAVLNPIPLPVQTLIDAISDILRQGRCPKSNPHQNSCRSDTFFHVDSSLQG